MICSVCNNPIESLNYKVGDAAVCHKCAAMYTLADLYVIFANEQVDGGISRNLAIPANANVVTLDAESAPETPSYVGDATE